MFFIDTHIHIDGEEFDEDRTEVIARAKGAGATAILVPAVDEPSVDRILKVCHEFPLPGGVFHCFTGNIQEARQLLEFDGFALGIGGVLTFKKSHLPEVVADIPIQRIVLETDAPYMAPVPMRGKRNESSFIPFVINRLAQSYNISPEKVADQTTDNVRRIFAKLR